MRRQIHWTIGLATVSLLSYTLPVQAESTLDIPDNIKDSPTLKKWRQQIPDVKTDIANDPAFSARLRLGYRSFGDESTNPTGWQIGIEDVQVGNTRATVSANYSGNASDRTIAADLHYSLMPLGKSFQVAPTIGYRRLTVNNNATTGINLGWRTRLILSRRSAADITFDQSWAAPGTDQETGLSTLSLGYAITPNMRIATDWQRQKSRQRKDDRFGISIEWMPSFR